MKQSVRLEDIARVMGISANTVSRALNDKVGVSDQTRAEIKKVARDMGYQPNLLARTLRGNASNIIGVIIDDNTNPYLAEVLKSIEKEARRLKYNILLFNSSSDIDREIEALKMLERIQACGVIMHPSCINTNMERAIESANFPVVIFGVKGNKLIADTIRSDNFTGMREMMRHLLQKSYQRIVFLNLPQQLSTSHERWEGVRAALGEFNLSENSIEHHHISLKEGVYHITRDLLTRDLRPDCILCACDVFAGQAMEAIYDSGATVPDDVAVAGYDDIIYAKNFRAPLTTVSQSKSIIGRQCIEFLDKRIKDEYSGAPVEMILTPKLIVREST